MSATDTTGVRRTRLLALVLAAVLLVAALATGVVWGGKTIADDVPAGATSTGISYGQGLGAVVQTGTTDGIVISADPDLTTIAAISSNYYNAGLMDPRTLDETMTMSPDAKDSISAAALAPDMRSVYYGGSVEGQSVVWAFDSGTGEQQWQTLLTGQTGNVLEIGVTRDGASLYVLDANTLHIVDARTGTISGSVELGTVGTMAVSQYDGNAYVYNSPSGTSQIAVIDQTGRTVNTFDDAPPAVSHMAISADNGQLYLASDVGVSVLDSSFTEVGSVGVGSEIKGLSVSSGTGLAVVTTGPSFEAADTVVVLDPGSGTLLTSIPMGGPINPDPLVASDLSAIYVSAGQPFAYPSRIDISASRASWGLTIGTVGALLALALIALLTGLLAPRWLPPVQAAQEKSRVRRRAEAEKTNAWLAKAHQEVRDRPKVQAENEHAQRVQTIQAWQRAYADANGGHLPPAGFAPPIVVNAAKKTNTMSILAFIFAFVFSLLGIIFGHIALSQIRRTGEGGRGLAIAALVLGYLALVALLIPVVVSVVLVAGR